MPDSTQNTILVVDDTESSRYALVRYLNRAGFVTWEAGTGAEGIRQANNQPDMVILDVHLPDVIGYDVCRRLKENPATSDIPVLHVSATFTTSMDKVRGLNGGADAYLAEPIEPDELLATINALLRIRRAERALRESEQRFRQLADAMPQIVWAARPDGHIDYYNRRWYEFTGFPPGEGDESWKPILHPADVQRTIDTYYAAIRSGSNYEIEYRFSDRRTGRYRWHLGRAVPIRNDQGEIVRWFGTCTDIDDQKRLEEILEAKVSERTAKLQETIGELEAFSYSISHDMRAPLRAMTQYSQIILEDFGPKLEGEERVYLQRIMDGCNRLDGLIQDVLTYSRVVRADIHAQPVDLDKLVRDMIHQYPQFRKQVAKIAISSPLLPVNANEAALTQCISNLLDNALKFAAKNRPLHVKIWTEPRNSEVRLWIEDNGIGIEAHNLKRIWGIFERVHHADEYEGTGIGLSIVRKAAERMGGSCGAESVVGEGSRFWIQIPAVR